MRPPFDLAAGHGDGLGLRIVGQPAARHDILALGHDDVAGHDHQIVPGRIDGPVAANGLVRRDEIDVPDRLDPLDPAIGAGTIDGVGAETVLPLDDFSAPTQGQAVRRRLAGVSAIGDGTLANPGAVWASPMVGKARSASAEAAMVRVRVMLIGSALRR